MEFIESGLKFNFDEAHWQVSHFDKNANYKKLADVVKETKAIDFLGIYQKKKLILFEIKSFRDHRIENKQRLHAGAEELATEVAQKVRDSLAAIIGARRNSTNDPEFWQDVARIMSNPHHEIYIISWIEEDGRDAHRMQHIKNKTSVDVSKMKNKFKWLTQRVSVQNVKNYSLSFEGFSCQFIEGS